MTNSSEYQHLASSKTSRSYKLITILSILAIVGAVCIYKGIANQEEAQISSQFVDLKSSRYPKCSSKTQILTPYLSGKKYKYKCCPRPISSCKRSKNGPPMIMKSYTRNNCRYNYCRSNCPKSTARKCGGNYFSRAYRQNGCYYYTCCPRPSRCPTGYVSKARKGTRCTYYYCARASSASTSGSVPASWRRGASAFPSNNLRFGTGSALSKPRCGTTRRATCRGDFYEVGYYYNRCPYYKCCRRRQRLDCAKRGLVEKFRKVSYCNTWYCASPSSRPTATRPIAPTGFPGMTKPGLGKPTTKPLFTIKPAPQPIACAEAMVICRPGDKPQFKMVNGCKKWFCPPPSKPTVKPPPITVGINCGPVAMPDCMGADYDLTKYMDKGCPQYKCCKKSIVPCNRMQRTLTKTVDNCPVQYCGDSLRK